ncbi:MAG: ABC transporter permease [Chlamydiales bacterium]|nr:ABC transporter permease [Chlamydiales bacterium]
MNRLSLTVFIQLLRRDLLAFKRDFGGKFFDTAFLFFTNVIVTAYFMSQEWVNPQFGPFIMIGAIASFGLIEVVGKVGSMIADLDGERTISQTLVFPIKPGMVFAYIGFFWAISSALLTLFLFPLGKVLMYTRFDLAKVSYLRLIPMFILANLFYGYFSLWITSLLKGISSLSSIWMRAINPMWMFGAYFYSWEAAYALSPVVGYASLINPMVYIMEGMRAAALGQEGFLPFWICIVVVAGYTVVLGMHSVHRLKKRLDCV